MKKYVFLIFTVALVMSCALAVASDENSKVYTVPGYKYILLENGNAEIVEYIGKGIDIVIPDDLDGHPVVSIGDRAFDNCSEIRSVVISEQITSIGVNPFTRCDKLMKIYVSPDHPVFSILEGVLFSKTDKRLICYPYSATDNGYDIPKGIRIIGDYAFFECKSLSKIGLPETLDEIGENAFANCKGLIEIRMAGSINKIGKRAFYECELLNEVVLQEGTNYIGEEAFSYCTSLNRIDLPTTVNCIADDTFKYCKSLVRIRIPEGVTNVGKRAFYNCKSLKDIILPESLVSIDDGAFREGPLDAVFLVEHNSYASQWCKEKNMVHIYFDSHFWLDE